MPKTETTPKTAEAHNLEAGIGHAVSTPNVPSATWDQILNPPEKRARELLELARIKCTRRWQGEDYPGLHGEVRLGVEATEHLREVLALIEEAQKYV